jgi:long-chain acyl-CoA synthetase
MQLLKDHHKTALIAGTVSLSFRHFMQHVEQRAQALRAHTFSKAAILAENSPGWVLAFYAVWKRGAVSVPIDHLSSVDDVAYILKDCQPEVLFCSPATREVAERAVAKAGTVTTVLMLDETSGPLPENAPAPELHRDPEDTAVIIYTSGTTGTPKGVMLSFRNIEVNCNAIVEADIFTRQQRILVMLPLHHILPLMGTLIGSLYCGATMIFTPSLAPSEIMETLQQHHATMIIGVPRFYALISANIRAKIQDSAVARTLYALARRINSKAFSRRIFGKVHEKFGGDMRILVCGGAPLDPSVAECLETLGFNMLEGYGMSEAAPMITFPRPSHYRVGACGQALPGCEVQIRDGEIVARGPNVMQGYYNRPDETAAILRDGWLYTGDLGRLDDEGFLYVTGRKKEIIILPNGKNVNPVELEEKIAESVPGVEEVAVFMQGSTLRAMVRPSEHAFATAPAVELEQRLQRQLDEHYNAQAAPYKRIARIHVIRQELPRTRMGKLRRFQLAELISHNAETSHQAERPEADPDSGTYRKLKSCLSTIVESTIHADDRLEADLGVDSLGRISLQVYIQEAFGIELDEKTFASAPTLRLLTELVDAQKTKDETGEINWQHILHSTTPQALPECGILHTLIVGFAKLLVRCWFRLRLEGAENIPDTPVIIAANHQSYFDGLFITSALSLKRMRNTFFYAKKKHVNNTFLRYLARHNNVIVVDVNSQLKQSVQKLAAVLRNGGNLIIFPEGTRTRTGETGTFRPTFAILSAELDVPVLPVAIDGAFDAMPAGKLLPRFRRPIRVKFLPPLTTDDRDYKQLAGYARQVITNDIQTP